MIEFPELNKYEEAVVSHLVSCPAESSVDSMYGWSDFGPCSLDEATKKTKRRRCELALGQAVEKGYVQLADHGFAATDLAYLRHDWRYAVRVRHSSTRVVRPDDLTRFVIRQREPRSYDRPTSVVVWALSHLDALDLAAQRLSRRGVHNDAFRSQTIVDHSNLRHDLPLSRDRAKQDLRAS